eukprot:TRINITY_DN3810_c0_g1_i1.p1 TRINITY_DN3810_c0_g1~~TRINITY_DN3810_c0_g1_i1.p1  ORF type:complete len:182 (-),score=81.78 TRINITY_DN3810_c0_g1_i1:99-644(-)
MSDEDSGNGPMVLADCKRGNINHLRKLIEEDGDKFDPNPVDGLGNGPLHYAATFNNTEIGALLLSLPNVNLDIQNYAGDTAVHKAVEKDHLDFLQLLVEKGANVSLTNKKGKAPQTIAVSNEARSLLKSAQIASQVQYQAKPKATEEKAAAPTTNAAPIAPIKAELDPSMIAGSDNEDEDD